MDIRTDVVEDRPAEIAALLRTIAAEAAGFGDQLDSLRGRYPAHELHGADPLAAMLDQAAAAAHDLHSSATSAANAVTGRSSTDGPHPQR